MQQTEEGGLEDIRNCGPEGDGKMRLRPEKELCQETEGMVEQMRKRSVGTY